MTRGLGKSSGKSKKRCRASKVALSCFLALRCLRRRPFVGRPYLGVSSRASLQKYVRTRSDFGEAPSSFRERDIRARYRDFERRCYRLKSRTKRIGENVRARSRSFVRSLAHTSDKSAAQDISDNEISLAPRVVSAFSGSVQKL